MELGLNLTHLNCYDPILNETLSQEETAESIVPDACPDILRIVDTEGMIFLTDKEVKEGRAELSGVVKAMVIYQPEEGRGLRRMEVTIPFKSTLERREIEPPRKLVAAPRIQSIDTRVLNPRKILVRVDLAIALKVFAPETAAVCGGTESSEEMGVQQRGSTQDAYLITAIQEKPFTFSDEISISGSRPGAQELLRNRAELWCSESKIIGNKLIFKGEVNLQFLYRAADDSLCTAFFALPFSQIMEVAGVGEDADSRLDILFTDVSCMLTGNDEGRGIAVTLGMLAQAVVREVRSVEMLSDVYSTVYELNAEYRFYDFYRLETSGTSRQTVREQLETELPVKSVIDIRVTTGQLARSREGESDRLAAEAEVTVLYLAEDDSIRAVSRRVSAACQLPLPEHCSCIFDCLSTGERLATPVADGLEVRFPLDFRYLALSPYRMAGVSRVTLDETKMRDTADQPSVILRMVEEEALWDIAKTYATTTGDIMRANGLVEDDAPRGRLLLIPKKR